MDAASQSLKRTDSSTALVGDIGSRLPNGDPPVYNRRFGLEDITRAPRQKRNSEKKVLETEFSSRKHPKTMSKLVIDV